MVKHLDAPTVDATAVPPTFHCEAKKTSTNNRVRVDGKFFARGSRRLGLQGVTYGPFALGADGAFPVAERVRDDFQVMREAGLNALRTYHVPPEWFLHLADENGINILI